MINRREMIVGGAAVAASVVLPSVAMALPKREYTWLRIFPERKNSSHFLYILPKGYDFIPARLSTVSKTVYHYDGGPPQDHLHYLYQSMVAYQYMKDGRFLVLKDRDYLFPPGNDSSRIVTMSQVNKRMMEFGL